VEADRGCVVSVSGPSALHIAAINQQSRQSNIDCGTKTQPWVLEAPAGQRINISLLDFTPGLTSDSRSQGQTGSASDTSSSSSSGSCVQQLKHQYGYVVDKSAGNKKNVSVCGGGFDRQTNIYLSNNNVLQVVLTQHAAANGQRFNFLLRVEGRQGIINSCIL
jgi:hypothetical protein